MRQNQASQGGECWWAKVGWERPLERLMLGTDLEGKREPGWGRAGRRAAPSETGSVEKLLDSILERLL